MKLLFIKPPKKHVTHLAPDLGLGYLSSYSKRAGHLVQVLDLNLHKDPDKKLKEKIEAFKPDFIGFKMFSEDFSSVSRLSALIKRINPEIITMAGGPHPSIDPYATLKKINTLDFLFKGEAEIGLVELLKNLESSDLSKIPSLVWRNKKDEVVVNQQLFFEPLDELGMPEWSLIDPRNYPDSGGVYSKSFPTAPIITSRGCPFNCAFCAVKVITGRKIRKRSPENVITEIKFLYDNYGVKCFNICDDNFTSDKNYTIDFCKKLIDTNLDVSWFCSQGVRLDSLDEETLSLMKKSGGYALGVGIESGSDRVLKLMNKHLDTKTVKEKIDLLNKFDFDITGFFILGFPGETKKEIKQTIRFSRKLKLNKVGYNLFMPIPCTEAYDRIKKEGGTNSLRWDDYSTDSVIYTPEGVSRSWLFFQQRLANFMFYIRPKILFPLLKEVSASKNVYNVFGRRIKRLLYTS
ncbi:MAG: radical SAM protein [Candidatus Woesearchaeota archaeon]